MAGNDAIHLLRGNGVDETTTLNAGQPYYNAEKNYLTIGNLEDDNKKINALPVVTPAIFAYPGDTVENGGTSGAITRKGTNSARYIRFSGSDFLMNASLVPSATLNYSLGRSNARFNYIYSSIIDTETIKASENADVTKDATIGGTLSVTGAATLKSTLNTTGKITAGSGLDVTGTASISGKVSASNGLEVSGNTKTGTLNVTGKSTFSDDLILTSNNIISFGGKGSSLKELWVNNISSGALHPLKMNGTGNNITLTTEDNSQSSTIELSTNKINIVSNEIVANSDTIKVKENAIIDSAAEVEANKQLLTNSSIKIQDNTGSRTIWIDTPSTTSGQSKFFQASSQRILLQKGDYIKFNATMDYIYFPCGTVYSKQLLSAPGSIPTGIEKESYQSGVLAHFLFEYDRSAAGHFSYSSTLLVRTNMNTLIYLDVPNIGLCQANLSVDGNNIKVDITQVSGSGMVRTKWTVSSCEIIRC